jgi:hypothetical protein
VDPTHVPEGADWMMRVSAGATKDYTDPRGNIWLPDHPNNREKYSYLFTVQAREDATYQNCPQEIETDDFAGPGLYCNERLFTEGTEGGYEIFVPDAGKYEILLHFADIYFDQPGQRIF